MTASSHGLDAFQVLADPSRRQILRLLTKERQTINAVAENFDMSRPAVSKHIKILETAGFIAVHDVGRERHCTLRQEGFREIQEWITFFDKFWASKVKKLENLMNTREKKKTIEKSKPTSR